MQRTFPKKHFFEYLSNIKERYPDNMAILYPEEYSYQDLCEEIDKLSFGLWEIGVRKGHHVGIWMINNPQWIISFFALAKIGAIVVPINTRYKVKDLEYILDHSDVDYLIMMDRFLNISLYAILDKVLEVNKNINLKGIVTLGFDLNQSNTFSYNYISKNNPNSQYYNYISKYKKYPEDTAIIQYTSGTTSLPKGAMLTHDNIICDAYYFGKNLEISSADIYHAPMPFYHVGGPTLTIVTALMAGASLVIQDLWDPNEARRLIKDYKCTITEGMDSMYKMIYELGEFDEKDVSSLRSGWVGGVPSIIKEARTKLNFIPIGIYGQTESSPNVSTTLISDPEEIAVNTQGKPHPGIELSIKDPITKTDLSHGKEGEICIRGWCVMKGYYKQHEQTKKTIDEEGWLHTGDLGVIDQEGRVKFTGRIKDMLKIGGENVSVLEVDNFLSSLNKVSSAEVVGVPDNRLGEAIVAFIKLKDGENATPEEIISECKGKIANFKTPKYVFFIDEFPFSSSHKVQKYVLREKAIQMISNDKVL